MKLLTAKFQLQTTFVWDDLNDGDDWDEDFTSVLHYVTPYHRAIRGAVLDSRFTTP